MWRLGAHLSRRSLNFIVLPLILLGCSRSFLEVAVLPSYCTSTDGAPKTLRCPDLARFEWATSNAVITYPPVLAQAGVSGHVRASIWVGHAGNVDSVKINSTPNAQFRAPVENALRRWRFKPLPGSVAADQRLLPVDILFKPGGCPDAKRLRQRVFALHAGMLVEVVACNVVLMRTVS